MRRLVPALLGACCLWAGCHDVLVIYRDDARRDSFTHAPPGTYPNF